MQSPCESWHLHVLKATCYKTTYKSYRCQFSSLGDINDISCILFLYKMDFSLTSLKKKLHIFTHNSSQVNHKPYYCLILMKF